jgi:hypothetical protein
MGYISRSLFFRFSNRWGRILVFPSAQDAPDDHPNAVINTLIELPAFIVGIFGGQASDWVQRYGDLGRDFTFGIGWLEFNLPSITGILIGAAFIAAFFIGFNESSIRKSLAVISLFLPVIILIIYSRAAFGFRDATYFQPRYFLPIFLVILAIALLQLENLNSIFTRFQYTLLSIILLMGSLFAWQATITRYTVNPLAAFTNFGQKIEWWPFPEYLSRLDIFFLSLLVHSLWIYSTIFTWGSKKKYESLAV